MGREKRNPQAGASSGSKERHRRNQRTFWDPNAPPPVGFTAKPAVPQTKSKHHSYIEIVENENKKKKLEFQVTTKTTPPPGFEFVPAGNPDLTKACKELSREKDAMIFIVSNTTNEDPNNLSHHVHRIGHHIREILVDEAKSNLQLLAQTPLNISDGKPEPLPESQEEYTAQVNAAILDFFPRIPHGDRQTILVQSFNLSSKKQNPKPVGLCAELPLSRRVQLAVLAHIRHNHTRYDELLKETTWTNSRKVVENLCLDILVKWRGDEETGRDQLDEILREVVVISDSEDDEDSSVEEITMADGTMTAGGSSAQASTSKMPQHHHKRNVSWTASRVGTEPNGVMKLQTPGRKTQRGFKRYRAWVEAIERNREGHGSGQASFAVSGGDRRTPFAGVQRDAQEVQSTTQGTMGAVPQPNGFVPRQSLLPAAPVDLPPRPHSASLTTPVHERLATPGVREPVAHASVTHIDSPLATRLQDMLIPSIEPASPEGMQPSFVRTLPPRTQLSPIRNSIHHRAFQPLRDPGQRVGAVYAERRVLGDRHTPDILPRRPVGYGDSYRERPVSQMQDPGRNSPRPALYANEVGGHAARASPNSLARTIVLDGGRPGQRPYPVLMQDRGGFYERVPANPQTIHRRSVNGEIWRAFHPAQGAGREHQVQRMSFLDEPPRPPGPIRHIRNADAGAHLRSSTPPPRLPPGRSGMVPLGYVERPQFRDPGLYEPAGPRYQPAPESRRLPPRPDALAPPFYHTQYDGGPISLERPSEGRYPLEHPQHNTGGPIRGQPSHEQQLDPLNRQHDVIVLD